MVVPLTRNTERRYLGAGAVVTVDGQSSKAVADQIMAADKTRLTSQLGALTKSDMLAYAGGGGCLQTHLGLPK